MAIEVKVPDIGSDEVEVTEILVKVGDKVEAEQSLITVEGDKVSMELPIPFNGIVKEIKVTIGDKVSTGSLLMLCEQEITSINSSKNNLKDTHYFKSNSYVHATPMIRRLAREFGINLAKINGTGRKKRIVKEDLQNYVINIIKNSESSTISEQKNVINRNIIPWPKINFRKFGEIKEINLSRIQKNAGDNLSRNWIIIPHVTHFDKADITDLEEFRKIQNDEAKKREIDLKLTPVVFIMKAVAVVLEHMPRFNSSLSIDGEKLILKKYINIGVAIDTPNGLVVPVFKDVNKKSITELASELISTSKKARNGMLTASDMQGGCFTISSLGSLGTTNFTPIINAPEVAILGISKFSIEPSWNGKEFIPRLMMPISLSFDHRVIDGADGARFITIINSILSDIRRLVM
ncbi:hypothetical protein FD728_00310 [Pantoea sp. Aalb]|nr:hypothetical protein [Pantoea sp. Aalb]